MTSSRVWLTVALTVGLLTLTTPPAQAAGSGTIVYHHGCAILSMDVATRTVTTVAEKPADGGCYFQATVSRTGRYVSWTKQMPVTGGTYVQPRILVLDRSTGVTSDVSQGNSPTFSPTDDRLAFADRTTSFDLFVMNPDGTGRTQLTHEPTSGWSAPSGVSAPRWSTDGSVILVSRVTGAASCIWSPYGNESYDKLSYNAIYSVSLAGAMEGPVLADPQGGVQAATSGGGHSAYALRVLGTTDPDSGGCGVTPSPAASLYLDGTLVTTDGIGDLRFADDGAAVFSTATVTVPDRGYPTTSNPRLQYLAPGSRTPVDLGSGESPSFATPYAAAPPTPPPPPAPVDTTISLNYAARKQTVIRTNGQVVPNVAGQTVTVTLEYKKGSKWRQVSKKSQALSSRSRYIIRFPRPNQFMCRLTAAYPGDARHKPARTQKMFTC